MAAFLKGFTCMTQVMSQSTDVVVKLFVLSFQVIHVAFTKYSILILFLKWNLWPNMLYINFYKEFSMLDKGTEYFLYNLKPQPNDLYYQHSSEMASDHHNKNKHSPILLN